MASISSSNTTLPPSYPSASSTISLRDASFSSYLNSTEESYIHSLRPKKVEDVEIDVFSADKYFNEGMDHESNTTTAKYHQQVKKNQTDTAMISLSNLKLQPRTPSIHSESSLNSQSALLRPVQRNPSRNNNINKKEKKSSSFLSCYCCDKKSIEIEDQCQFNNHGNRSINNEYNRGIPRTIKTSFDTAEITRLNKLRLDHTETTDPLTLVKTMQEEDEEERRRKKSLEVFGSNDEEDKRFSLDKRLNMLSWDAISRPIEEINTSGPPSETCKDDTESDASSDLFEIECLSCTANMVGLVPRHESSGYAPSEASIDWSVVTASAVDNSTVLDSEDQMSTLTSVTSHKVGPNKGGQKPRSVGMLSGCKNQKAVRVAGDAYRSSDKRKSGDSQRVHRFSDSYATVTRFQADAKLPGHGLSQSNRISGSHRLHNY